MFLGRALNLWYLLNRISLNLSDLIKPSIWDSCFPVPIFKFSKVFIVHLINFCAFWTLVELDCNAVQSSPNSSRMSIIKARSLKSRKLDCSLTSLPNQNAKGSNADIHRIRMPRSSSRLYTASCLLWSLYLANFNNFNFKIFRYIP